MAGQLQTISGKIVDVVQPTSEMFDIWDIAIALGNQARYAGHTGSLDQPRHYSVAQHCVACAQYAAQRHETWDTMLWCLLHDASEAYMVDVPSGVKRLLPMYQAMENNLLGAIGVAFGLPEKMPDVVKHIDNRILVTERDVLMSTITEVWEPWEHLKPIPEEEAPFAVQSIREYWTPGQAAREFMISFKNIKIGQKAV